MSSLRPQFTDRLLTTLKIQSVNIYGKAGQGQTRLLIDLTELAQAQGFIILHTDIKPYIHDYDGMVKNLSQQIKKQLNLTEDFADLAAVLTAIDTHANNKIALWMIEQFDSILDSVQLDEKYEKFLNNLNSFKNQIHRRVLLSTVQKYDMPRFYAKEGIYNLSFLDLTVIELNSLSYNEIKDELQVKARDLTGQQLNELTRVIHEHKQAGDFLEHCLQQLNFGNHQDLVLTKRLRIWQKTFKQQHKHSIRRQLDRVLNALGVVGRELNNLSLKVKLFLVSIAGFIGVFTDLFDKVKQPAISLWQYFKGLM